MIHIYLCEDDAEQLQFLANVMKHYVEQNSLDADVFSVRENPRETLLDIENNGDNPALFLLDVELKGYSMDGFSLCREIKKRKGDFFFVFLTSKNELAYKAFEYELDILDYIIKEREYFLERLIHTKLRTRLDRVFEKIEQKQNVQVDVVWVECGSRKVELNVESLICVRAVKGTHQLEVLTGNRRIMVRMTLEQMKNILGDRMIEVSKSCVVMKNKIKEIDRKKRLVILENGISCEIAFRKVSEVWNMIKETEMS